MNAEILQPIYERLITGDLTARDELIIAALPLAEKVIRRHIKRHKENRSYASEISVSDTLVSVVDGLRHSEAGDVTRLLRTALKNEVVRQCDEIAIVRIPASTSRRLRVKAKHHPIQHCNLCDCKFPDLDDVIKLHNAKLEERRKVSRQLAGHENKDAREKAQAEIDAVIREYRFDEARVIAQHQCDFHFPQSRGRYLAKDGNEYTVDQLTAHIAINGLPLPRKPEFLAPEHIDYEDVYLQPEVADANATDALIADKLAEVCKTDRERRIVALSAKGHDRDAISKMLGIHFNTVTNTRNRIRNRLNQLSLAT